MFHEKCCNYFNKIKSSPAFSVYQRAKIKKHQYILLVLLVDVNYHKQYTVILVDSSTKFCCRDSFCFHTNKPTNLELRQQSRI